MKKNKKKSYSSNGADMLRAESEEMISKVCIHSNLYSKLQNFFFLSVPIKCEGKKHSQRCQKIREKLNGEISLLGPLCSQL